MKNNNDFEFTYYAPTNEERKEIESIKNNYTQKKKTSHSTKLDCLRKLDKKVKNIPTAMALIFGVVGTLIFGLGLSMILEWRILIWGIVVCMFSLIPIFFAYPMYKFTTNRLKKKYSKEIIKLSDELLYEEKQ